MSHIASMSPNETNYGTVRTSEEQEEHPTQDPFTAPEEPSNVNNSLGGALDQLQRKLSRLFGGATSKS
ncbi:hypothetical protein EC973_002312 [Apophysomyces ossiformis]|uniref:Uncharacterized protein n=1 Tax=Apophysomyces ossiformis TaxID=679940 RepID=A0A8H7BIJ5_9FUNG|nr:hypothetical protein EC973_002312 [Apophysomyces ossiformis]